MTDYSPEFASLQRVVAGRYSLVREIGRGGMGIVFLARDVALDRPVAIKLLPPELARDTTFRERFLQEARMAASLAHPHIVPIHSVEAHDEVVFFVMAFVDGESLGERVRQRGPSSAAEAARVVQEVAWALAHAHARGIVHHDIKPDNILIDRESGRVMVTDFGIARVVSSDTAAPTAGTPHYLSPEQMRGEPVDGRCDLYSLGVTAWHTLTGDYPFDAPNVSMLLVRQSTEQAPPLRTIAPSVPARFANAVDRCLRRVPAERWASAEELAVELNAIRARSGELPAPLRAWLRDVLPAGNDIGLGFGGVVASLSVWALLAELSPSSDGFFAALDNAFITVAMSLAASLFTGLAVLRLGSVVASTRDLIAAGYDHDQARRALVESDAERAAERSEVRRAGRRRWSMLLGLGGGAAITALAIWGATLDDPTWLALPATALSVLVPIITIRAALKEMIEGPSPWSRLMRGRFGRAVFKVARVFTGSRKGVPSAAQPTIVALGLEAESLFRALPPAMRDQLHDLPGILAALRARAEQLRVDDREAVGAERISGVVAAMESIRLELMGIGAGVRSVPDVTRNLEEARRLAERMEQAARRRDITPKTPTPGLSGLDRTP